MTDILLVKPGEQMPWSDVHHQPGTDARLADLEISHFSSMSRSPLLVFSWFNGPTTLIVTIPLWSCMTNNLFHSMWLGGVLRGERRICWVALRPILAQWACGGHVWFEYRHWHGALPMRGAFHGRSNILQTSCQRLFSSNELWLLVVLGQWHFQKIFFLMLVFGKTKLCTFSKAEFSDKFLLWSKMFEGLRWMKAGFVIFSSEFHRWQIDWKSRIAFFLSIHLQNPSPTPSLHQQHDGDYHLDCGGIVGNWRGRSQARSPTFPSHCSVLLPLHILFHPFRHQVYHHHHCWICLPEYNFTKV